MNETMLLARVFGLGVWIIILLRFRSVQPPPTRAGRYTGPLAAVLLLSAFVLGGANPIFHLVQPDSLSPTYSVVAIVAGLLGLAWLMLSTSRQ